MLYHLDDPSAAIWEANRVLQRGGLLAACAASRWNDPEIMADGYPPTTFDAEAAYALVAAVFGDNSTEIEQWDEPMVRLDDHDEVLAYARSHLIPVEIAEQAVAPLTLTKRGCLVWARKA
jgi:hypothetical protein